jgi:putative tricarboxylic transport membrane protein
MDEIASLIGGFQVAMSWYNLALMLVGIVLGVIIGVLPGLGGANGVAILLPLTFTMPPTSAIIMLSCIYWGALFGGAITSILFNIPGEPWSVATTFDGHPMAQRGRADEALTAAFTSSFIGAFVAVVMITFLAPVIAKFALQFGPAEFFAVFFLTFASFIGMSKSSPFKVIAAMALGFALGAVGLDKMTGSLRLTFGSEHMLAGFDFLIAVIGLFGIGEILTTVQSGLKFEGAKASIRLRAVLDTWRKLLKYWGTSLRSCLIGCWMGITPGGATPASFMAYGIAKRFSPSADNFGKGEIEGVVAPETAAHAAGTSALLPMLTLGIPGSPTAAVLLGGLMIWGLQPGPMLFVEKKDFVWGLIASMYLGNIVGLIVVLTCVPLFAAILRVPFSIIAPAILVICAVGAYTVKNNMFDVWMMLGFGVIGYVFQKLEYPLAPMVLAIVLGDKAEEAFRQALLGSQGSLGVFWSNWLVASIMTLGMVLLLWPVLGWLRAWAAPKATVPVAGGATGATGMETSEPSARTTPAQADRQMSTTLRPSSQPNSALPQATASVTQGAVAAASAAASQRAAAAPAPAPAVPTGPTAAASAPAAPSEVSATGSGSAAAQWQATAKRMRELKSDNERLRQQIAAQLSARFVPAPHASPGEPTPEMLELENQKLRLVLAAARADPRLVVSEYEAALARERAAGRAGDSRAE